MVIIYLGMKDQIGQKDIIFILHTVIKKWYALGFSNHLR